MNAYGWGAMMRDFCFLEDMGRKVGEWGDVIVRGGYQAESRKGKKDNRRRLPKSHTGWKRKQAARHAKREMLAAYLESLDIEIDLLPVGMERRSLSQSTWDSNLKRPLLSIEFKLYSPSRDGLHTNPYTLVTHRNLISRTLIEIMRSHFPLHQLRCRKQKENALPEWVPPIVHSSLDNPQTFVLPDCYIPATIDFPLPNAKGTHYHKLDPTLTFSELLRGTRFVEFPTIHVFDPTMTDFRGIIIDKSGRIARHPQYEQRLPKRRKIDSQVITGLLAGYNTDNDSDPENNSTLNHAVLETMGTYSDTDPGDDGPSGNSSDHGEDHGDDLEGSTHSETEEPPMEPQKLLELVRQARGVAGEDLAEWSDGTHDGIEEF